MATTSSAVVVLVAEDETLVRMYVTETLEDAGFEVYEARDGQEALTILEVRGHVVRALVSDVAMPNLGGLDLARIVADRWPHIGIVLASAYPGPNLREQVPEGARFLHKPYKGAELVEALNTVLHSEEADQPGPPVALHSFPSITPGNMHGAGGLAQPLPEPEN